MTDPAEPGDIFEKRGCRTEPAEIIPKEPDADHTDVGKAETHVPLA